MKREREREDGAERQRDERKEGQNKKKKKKGGKDVGRGQNRNISCLSVSRLACEVQLMPLRWLCSAAGIHVGARICCIPEKEAHASACTQSSFFHCNINSRRGNKAKRTNVT